MFCFIFLHVDVAQAYGIDTRVVVGGFDCWVFVMVVIFEHFDIFWSECVELVDVIDYLLVGEDIGIYGWFSEINVFLHQFCADVDCVGLQALRIGTECGEHERMGFHRIGVELFVILICNGCDYDIEFVFDEVVVMWAVQWVMARQWH